MRLTLLQVQNLISVEPRKREPRRLAILLDEFHVDDADSTRVRDAITRFVADQMRPGDTAVVLKPLDPLTSIRLTDDRDALRAAIATFEGRKGNYEPRSALEEETMGRAPALVDAGRAQVVLSGLRALATQLGASSGRSAIQLAAHPIPLAVGSRDRGHLRGEKFGGCVSVVSTSLRSTGPG